MISLIRYVAHLVDPHRADFAAWDRELRLNEPRLTSAPWVGWLEELDERPSD